jgi:hypothetical protein
MKVQQQPMGTRKQSNPAMQQCSRPTHASCVALRWRHGAMANACNTLQLPIAKANSSRPCKPPDTLYWALSRVGHGVNLLHALAIVFVRKVPLAMLPSCCGACR